MSGSGDSPGYWARSEADIALREMPAIEPGALADLLERTAANEDGDPQIAASIVAELRHRAAAGVRFWPASTPIGGDGAFAPASRCRVLPKGGDDTDIAWLIDDEIPW